MLDIHAAAALAECRRAGTHLHVPLHELRSRIDAEFSGGSRQGARWHAMRYKIGATSIEVQTLQGRTTVSRKAVEHLRAKPPKTLIGRDQERIVTVQRRRVAIG